MLTVVLVDPELPANVGFTARTLACFGLSRLRIVDGREPAASALPGIASQAEARRTASGGEAVLDGARYFTDLQSAVADCALAFGFSRRSRIPSQRILDLAEAAALPEVLDAAGGASSASTSRSRIALVFGCESRGLSREHTLRLTHLVRIPLRDPVLSLNLSHAVAIALYAFLGAAPSIAVRIPAASPTSGGEGLPAEGGEPVTLGEGERLLSAVLAALSERGHFKASKAEAQAEYLRLLWQRLRPTRRELEFLAGILKRLAS